MTEAANQTHTPAERLTSLGRQLRELHRLALETEKSFHPPMGQLELLERLVKDPAWSWLRPLSALAADIEHVAQGRPAPTLFDLAVAAAHVRDLLGGRGSQDNENFLARYVPLMQSNVELASVHGQLRQYLQAAPAEAADEAERLHLRHQWAMRCKHDAGSKRH